MPIKGKVDQPIGRHPSNRQKMAVNARNGRDAVTHYRVLQDYRGALSLLECKLETGRTHQIRVHMGHMGHPVVGDPLYGPQPTALKAALTKADFDEKTISEALNFPRQVLHACAISFLKLYCFFIYPPYLI